MNANEAVEAKVYPHTEDAPKIVQVAHLTLLNIQRFNEEGLILRLPNEKPQTEPPISVPVTKLDQMSYLIPDPSESKSHVSVILVGSEEHLAGVQFITYDWEGTDGLIRFLTLGRDRTVTIKRAEATYDISRSQGTPSGVITPEIIKCSSVGELIASNRDLPTDFVMILVGFELYNEKNGVNSQTINGYNRNIHTFAI